MPFHTAHSRHLVEAYWRSVLQSTLEPPLYHTFSDRYRGTQGIPFAARTDCSAVLTGLPPIAGGKHETLAWCMEQSELNMAAGNIREARLRLQQALTQLQNSDGGLSVETLVSTRGCTIEEHQRSANVAEVLRRLANIALLCHEPEEGLRLLDWSREADPLTPETYVLQASCYEKMGEWGKTYDEFEKYLKLHEPTMEMLSHCGKCAAKAGNSEAAERHLRRLLEAAKQLQESCTTVDGVDAVEVARFYTSHAYFYLGYVCETEAQKLVGTDEAAAAMMRTQSSEYFTLATANSAYVDIYNTNVEQAIEAGDYPVALQLLCSMQQMEPERGDHFLRTALVCHKTGDSEGEVRALSEALDRHQTLSARRTTLLTRGTVYGEIIGDLERAIKDYTLVIEMPSDDTKDRCTPVAFLKRAETYRRRYARAPTAARKEDQEAALVDYFNFLGALQERADGVLEENVSDGVCHPSYVTDALLILANGSFRKKSYTEASRYFARAMTRGWTLRPPQPGCSTSSGPVQESLYDQMYISLAHHVMQQYLVGEDIFKVPYEPREWVVPVQQDGGKKAKLSERREVERNFFAFPSLSYSIVDARYAALRSLEPTVFTALEGEFLELWEPYRAEVERTRDDLTTTRGGKRAKRF